MTNITRTEFTVVSTDTEYGLPGDWTAEQIKVNYATQIQGLQNMVSEERVEQRPDGSYVRVVTFKPRTGTKG